MPPYSFLCVLRRLLRSARGGSRHARAALWAAGITVLILLVGSWLTVLVERPDPRATITTFPRALWWSVETATTVGYGDFYPVTPGGRAIAAVVMLVGIATFSLVTAALATWLVSSATRDMRRLAAGASRLEHRAGTEAADELRSLHDRFDRVEHLLRQNPAPKGPE
jgi:voltage-gated potassium channel